MKSGSTFFVATNGNDAWTGNQPNPNIPKNDGPFLTLARARDAVRELKKNGLNEPVTIMVRAGTYFFDDALVLNEKDSGTRDYPITWCAYPGEKPVLSGGRKVSGWQPYKGHVVKAEIPETRGGNLKFRQLFYNGNRMPRARWPKADPENPFFTGWAFMEGPAAEGSSTSFRYKPGTFPRPWAKPSQGEVNVYSFVGWTMKTVPIKSFDEKNRVITLTFDSWNCDINPWYIPTPFLPENRFYIDNILEELTQPGEWCLDDEEGILYFWPPDDKIQGEAVIPALDRLIDLHGVSWQRMSWVNISGFTFTQTLDGDNLHPTGLEGCGAMGVPFGLRYCGEAVRLRHAEYCTIDENLFDNVGGNAIYLQDNTVKNVVRNNEIKFAGANGICLAGSKIWHPVFNEITDNHIHHCGILNKYIAGVFCGYSDGNRIAHNRIEYLPHHAINLANNPIGRNIVEYNEIRWVCREIADNGAVNSWMELAPREDQRCGHIIRYNLIADIYGSEIKDGKVVRSFIFPTSGVYLDNYSSNCLVYGNLFIRIGNAGVLIQGGKNNMVENNIFIDCGIPVRIQNDVMECECYKQFKGMMTGNRIERNICYQTRPDAMLYHLGAWTDQVLARCDDNVFFRTDGKPYILNHTGNFENNTNKPAAELDESRRIDILAKWQKLGYDTHSRFENPMFVDVAKEDYRLKKESPAWGLGFQPIPIGRIGRLKSGEASFEAS